MKSSQQKDWITKTEFSQRIGWHYKLDQPKLKQAIDRGELNTKAGKIDWHQARIWWETHTQTRHSPYRHRKQMTNDFHSRQNGIPDLRDSQARKEAAMAELRELEAAEKRGELMNKRQAIKTIFECARRARDIMMAIPKRVSGTIATETDQRAIQQLLEQEIENGLKALEHVKM